MFAELSHLNEDREEGFTLIELLVVIVIVGILAAIAVISFIEQRKRANDRAVESDIKNAATQMHTVTMDIEHKPLGPMYFWMEQESVFVAVEDRLLIGDTDKISSGEDSNAQGGKQSPGTITAGISPSNLSANLLASPAEFDKDNASTITLSSGVTFKMTGGFYGDSFRYTLNAQHENGHKYTDDNWYRYKYVNNFSNPEESVDEFSTYQETQ